jgi:hypothetical protein
VIDAQNSWLWVLRICSDLDTGVQCAALERVGESVLIFASAKFFLFLVGRYSANFASPRPRKSFAGWRLVCGGGAKLSEFRLGGVTKIVPGEA